MFSIFLVDDDDIERRGIKMLPLFQRLGLEIIGEAWNGALALEKIRQLKPDIVLFDVRMPVMDGLTMAKVMMQEMPEIKAVMMSGYEDFETVREAIQLGVSSFLTKPLNIEELGTTLSRIADELESEQRQIEHQQNVDRYMDKMMPVLREHLLHDRMLGIRLSDDQDFQNDILETEVFQYVKRFCVLEIRIDNWQSDRLGPYNAFEVLQELENSVGIIPVTIHGGVYALVLVLSADLDDEAIFNQQQKCAAAVMEKLNAHQYASTIGISEDAYSLSDLAKLYRQANLALLNQEIYGSGRVYWYDSQELGEEVQRPDITETVCHLHQALAQSNPIALDRIIDAFSDRLQAAVTNISEINSLILELLVRMIISIREDGKDFLEVFDVRAVPVFLGDGAAIDQSVREYLKELFAKTLSQLYVKPISESERLVKQVQKIIEERYAENISAETISRELFIGPSHLRRLFKNLTGQTIQDSILVVRMKRAQELLMDPSIKVYKIAEAVGFESQSYFGIVFKKYFGMTTSEYRNAVIQEI